MAVRIWNQPLHLQRCHIQRSKGVVHSAGVVSGPPHKNRPPCEILAAEPQSCFDRCGISVRAAPPPDHKIACAIQHTPKGWSRIVEGYAPCDPGEVYASQGLVQIVRTTTVLVRKIFQKPGIRFKAFLRCERPSPDAVVDVGNLMFHRQWRSLSTPPQRRNPMMNDSHAS